MITRIWRGWTTPVNADAYEHLLRTQVIPGIVARHVSGFRGMSFGRSVTGPEVEFVTIMWFDDLDAVRAFAGDAYDVAVVPPAARAVLARFDERSSHYETILEPPGMRA